MKKLLVICGPTATGKTSLGIQLARSFDGEIVSADSRQVYKDMDIGTGKDLFENLKLKIVLRKAQDNAEQSRSIDCHSVRNPERQLKIKNLDIGYYETGSAKIWLYDVCQPDYQFSVADYLTCTKKVIENIWRRNKLPIVVGGTGFYIEALISGIGNLGIKPDWELRKQLDNWSARQLASYLKEIDSARWTRMNGSDRQNPRRLVRAVEIALKRKEPRTENKEPRTKFNHLTIGLRTSFKELYRRIDLRVEQRVDQGIEKEIKTLLAQGYNWQNSVLGTTIGYKEWDSFFKAVNLPSRQSAKLKSEIIQKWKFAEHSYARRQMTWFKKQATVNWFDIGQVNHRQRVEKFVQKWYDNYGGIIQA